MKENEEWTACQNDHFGLYSLQKGVSNDHFRVAPSIALLERLHYTHNSIQ